MPEGANFPPFRVTSWLRSETGEGSVEDYVEHPMNFNKSKSVARMLRGLTGIMGNLRLAVIDIVMGGMEFAKERKQDTPANPI